MAELQRTDHHEVWKPVANHEELYEVSNLGRVRRLSRVQYRRNRWGTESRYLLPEQILSPTQTSTGRYLTVNLWKDGQNQTVRLNILVCQTFHGPAPQEKPFALHNNGDSFNNRATNLRWGDIFDNMADRTAHGRTVRGERQHSARLTACLVRSIRQRASNGERIAPIAREIGVHPSSIHAVVKRETWKHVT